jgi:DNA-binding beta-propeller fold protein YncE
MGSKLARWVAALGTFAVLGTMGIAAVPRHTAPQSRELLYLDTLAGVTAVDPDTGHAVFSARDALPSGDWSLLVSAQEARHRGTRVDAIDPADGRVLSSERVPGSVRVRTVSYAGGDVALMPRSYDSAPGRAEGRRSTHIVVTGFDGRSPQTVDVPANVEPEAFSSDARSLFVLQYKPAMHPDRYQVRELDIATGTLSDVFTDDKDIQGDMQGIARTQALSPDGNKLYTLYTKGSHEAFVHVLDLRNATASCVDLPEPFGEVPGAMAVAASPDGRHLYVADTAHGRVADVDTSSLTVGRTQRLANLPSGGGVPAATASDQALYVARGGRVSAVRVVPSEPFRALATWRFDSAVQSVQVPAGEADALYVAERRQINVVDPRSGKRVNRIEAPAGLGIRHVGYVLPQTSIGSYQCAC